MKNKAKVITLLTAVAVLLTACGSKEYLKDLKPEKYVSLGEYKGIEVQEKEPSVDEGVVDSYLDYMLSTNAEQIEVTDRAIKQGDIVSIDYAGYMDGEAFEGGTGSKEDLTIGSGAFIDGFEDGLVGHEIGEQVSLDLTFPDPYQNNPALSGAPVVFEVTIKGIKEAKIPTLDDAYVESLGLAELHTVEELTDFVYNMFYEDATATFENNIETKITDAVMAGCTFKELPEKFIDRYYQQLIDGMNAQASSQGMILSDYVSSYYGINMDAFTSTMKDNARTISQQYVMFAAIAKAEGITLSEEEIEEEINNRVEAYNYASADEFKNSTDIETFKEALLADKVMDFLKENANITTVPAEEN